MKKCAAALASLVILSGCTSTPEADTGSVRLDSPEVHSQPFHVKLAIGLDKGQPIPIGNAPLKSNDTGLFVSGEMSLGAGFSAKYQTGKAVKATLKYQFSGQHAETSQAGNVSHAITLGYLSDHESGVESKEESNLSPATSRAWDLDHDLIDIAWITGYRLSEETLLYGSVFYQTGEIDGTYYRTTYNGCGEQYAAECTLNHFSDDGSAFGVSLSLEYAFTKSFLGSFEVVHSRSNWFNRNEDDTLVNGNFIYQF
ncbi:hypothetical protein N473_10185 [Pseudoalteromonas luteoviolacea CPMOR-1]|uniref:Outer membrane protein beta-barrel domain-containing protein n=1 Tax=Pseudoalteromonas luteoviolacea CPMOR-1 TaxID=1365248 RepID=A0A161YU20_9GAMM|nr:hypothetical protein [Pseudoalteromonas luteoviolacea]KZN65927.1 hypothetical protein N473_10185 [Pseudoalteromonas luteoviolacea CPMOR-1]